MRLYWDARTHTKVFIPNPILFLLALSTQCLNTDTNTGAHQIFIVPWGRLCLACDMICLANFDTCLILFSRTQNSNSHSHSIALVLRYRNPSPGKYTTHFRKKTHLLASTAVSLTKIKYKEMDMKKKNKNKTICQELNRILGQFVET